MTVAVTATAAMVVASAEIAVARVEVTSAAAAATAGVVEDVAVVQDKTCCMRGSRMHLELGKKVHAVPDRCRVAEAAVPAKPPGRPGRSAQLERALRRQGSPSQEGRVGGPAGCQARDWEVVAMVASAEAEGRAAGDAVEVGEEEGGSVVVMPAEGGPEAAAWAAAAQAAAAMVEA